MSSFPRSGAPRVLAVLVVSAGLLAGGAAAARADGQWQEPGTLSDGARNALGVAVADAAQAAPFAAWEEWQGGIASVHAARLAGAGWTAPVQLSRGPVEGGTIRMAANEAGTAMAVWRSAAGRGVSAARFSGGRWGRSTSIAGAGALSARVAMDVDGTATIVWTEPDSSGTRRVRAVRLAAQAVDAPQWISPAGEPVEPIAYVSAGRAGSTHAVWLAVHGGHHTVEVATSTGGDWSTPATWSTPARDAASPRIAASPDGDVAVAWTEADGGRWSPMARVLDSGRLGATRAVGPSADQIPQIAVAAGGAERVAVAWTAITGGATGVGAALRDTAGWREPVAMPDADSPQVAMAADGRAALAYRGLREGTDAILARFGEDGQWSEPVQIGTTNAIYGPRVSVGPSGGVTAIWTTSRAGGPDVAVAARETSRLSSSTPHIDEVASAIRDMERRTGSDSSEGILWQKSGGNALDGAGTQSPAWLVRTQDCWGRTDTCTSGGAQQHMLDTIRSIVANADQVVDVSSLAAVADGGFRDALIAGVREADAAGRRPVVRMVWGHQPAAPFSVRKLRQLQADLQSAAPDLQIVLALHKNTLIANGYSWNHSKIVAADGKVAYVAGINMWSASYLQSNNPVTDVGMVVRGPAALAAHRFLDVIWTEMCTYPRWSLKHANTLVPDGGGAHCPASEAPATALPAGNTTVLAVGRAGYASTGLTTGTLDPADVSKADRSDSGCKVPPLPNTMNGEPKWDGNNPSDAALRALVNSARSKVVMAQQEATFGCARLPSYDVRLFDALARKVVAGIPVTIVLSNENGGINTFEGYSSNPSATLDVMHRRLRKLLGSDAAATRAACKSLSVDRFRYSNAGTWPNLKEPAQHGKVIAVDDAAFYIGSQNAYPNQLQEFGYIVEDPAAMADLKRDYLDPLVHYSSRAALSCDGLPGVPPAWRTGVLDRIPAGTEVGVSLGDSFISGEAGRWRGNVRDVKNADLIDAGAPAYWDTPTGESEAKCHRSATAEIHIDGLTPVNLACSGAITTSMRKLGAWKPGIDRGQEGTSNYGQLTLLDALARHTSVRLITLSIGGNDMGFSKVILACIGAFARPNPVAAHCKDSKSTQARLSDAALATVGNKVQHAIERVDATMRDAGYADGDWQFVVQGYPMPLASPLRYPETYKGRFSIGGCPFYDGDLTWIAQRIPALNAALRTAAQRAAASTGRPVAFMDLQQAFAGRELCSTQASFVDQLPSGPLRSSSAERVSMLRVGDGFAPAEAIHPNALGQVALQSCLQQAWNGGVARSGSCQAPLDWSQADPSGRPLMQFAPA